MRNPSPEILVVLEPQTGPVRLRINVMKVVCHTHEAERLETSLGQVHQRVYETPKYCSEVSWRSSCTGSAIVGALTLSVMDIIFIMKDIVDRLVVIA